MNQLPSKPRFYFAHRQAIRALIHLGVNALPFDPLKAIRLIGCKAYSYQQCIQEYHVPIRDIVVGAESKDGCVFPLFGKYAILYNTEGHTQTRIRWTLAHELAHILLGHLTDFTSEQLAFDKREDHDVLDQEADACAAGLLAPSPILYRLGFYDAATIRSACKLSWKAASYREHFFLRIAQTYRQYFLSEDDIKLLWQFYSFIMANARISKNVA